LSRAQYSTSGEGLLQTKSSRFSGTELKKVSSSVSNIGPSSVWITIARVVAFGIIGSIALALAGFAEGLIAFPVFSTVHEVLFRGPEGKVGTSALSSGLPLVLASLGCLFGGLAIAILSGFDKRAASPWKSLAHLITGAVLGTAFGVVAGALGGLALGWSLMPTHVGLFVGYFYGTSLCFLVALVVSLFTSARNDRIRSRARGDGSDDRVGRGRSVAWRIAMTCLAVGYVATCAGALIVKKSAGNAALEARTARIAQATLTRTGQTAPLFQVSTTDGKTFDSGSKRDGPVLVNFFATWCGPCQSELARLEPEIWQRYRDRGLTVIVIGVGETDEAVGEFRTKRGLSFPMAADPEREVSARFATDTIPRTYLIRPDGRIAYQSVGYTEASFGELEDAIKRELGQPQKL
jgi:peroxiredoxin